jgi:glycosyltransferase involved in cell wall biosynthesis
MGLRRVQDILVDFIRQRMIKNGDSMKTKLAVSMFGQKRLSREGGIEIVVKELCTRLVQDGYPVTCYNRSGHHVSGAEYDQKTEYEGICQKKVPTIEGKGLAAVSSSFFAAFFSAIGHYDVVHIHAEGPAFFAWLPKLFRKRVVVTIHGIDWQREKWKSGFGSKFIRQGEKNAVKYADEIIVLSKGVQTYFKDTYGRETRFIPNGVNRPELRAARQIAAKFGLEKDSYILFLGRLVPEKGIRYLVEAFKKVKTDKKLVIAGGSSDTESFMEELKELAKSDERILFTGFVQGEILDELYSNAYLYILPSDLEGMPLSLLEAMSYGNCCLVSNIPECTEVVEDKALIFKKSDVNDLRKKLQEACDEPEKVKALKEEAADFICRKYNWDEVVKETLELYEGEK